METEATNKNQQSTTRENKIYLIKCPSCQNDVARTAVACPSCGISVAKTVAKLEREKAKKELRELLKKIINSRQGIIALAIFCFLLTLIFYRVYYVAEYEPEKVIANKKEELNKKLDKLNNLRAHNGNLGSFSEYSSEYNLLENANYETAVKNQKAAGAFGTFIFVILTTGCIIQYVRLKIKGNLLPHNINP